MQGFLAVLCVIGAWIYLIVFVVAGTHVAAQKGRPEGEGILFGILFGPLGLILVACLPDGPTRLQAAGGPAPAPAPEVTRISDWLGGVPRAATRTSPFARLVA
jgi:hypothetical protein